MRRPRALLWMACLATLGVGLSGCITAELVPVDPAWERLAPGAPAIAYQAVAKEAIKDLGPEVFYAWFSLEDVRVLPTDDPHHGGALYTLTFRFAPPGLGGNGTWSSRVSAVGHVADHTDLPKCRWDPSACRLRVSRVQAEALARADGLEECEGAPAWSTHLVMEDAGTVHWPAVGEPGTTGGPEPPHGFAWVVSGQRPLGCAIECGEWDIEGRWVDARTGDVRRIATGFVVADCL